MVSHQKTFRVKHSPPCCASFYSYEGLNIHPYPLMALKYRDILKDKYGQSEKKFKELKECEGCVFILNPKCQSYKEALNILKSGEIMYGVGYKKPQKTI